MLNEYELVKIKSFSNFILNPHFSVVANDTHFTINGFRRLVRSYRHGRTDFLKSAISLWLNGCLSFVSFLLFGIATLAANQHSRRIFTTAATAAAGFPKCHPKVVVRQRQNDEVHSASNPAEEPREQSHVV